jgi:hypothetical protein
MMKPFLLTLTLFGMVIAAPQRSNAQTVVHGPNGTYVHGHRYGGTVVHTNYNWNNVYWRTNKYGYWNGQRGYWRVVNGNHIFVVVR